MAKHIPTVFFHDLPQQQCGEVFWYWSDSVDCIFCAIFPRFWKGNISQHQMMEQQESLPSWAQEAYRPRCSSTRPRVWGAVPCVVAEEREGYTRYLGQGRYPCPVYLPGMTWNRTLDKNSDRTRGTPVNRHTCENIIMSTVHYLPKQSYDDSSEQKCNAII